MATATLTTTFWQQRSELLWRFAQRQLQSRFAGSMLGVLWTVLHPLLQLALYTFVFSSVMRLRLVRDVSGTDCFVTWLFAGLWPWMFFAESVGQSCGSLISEPQLLKRTLLPPWILPASCVLSGALLHTVGLVIFLVYMALTEGLVSVPGLLALVVPGVTLVAYAMAMAWLVAALTVFLRDLGQAIGVLLTFAFYLTPIIYPVDAVPAPYDGWMRYNPLLSVVDGYRLAIFHGEWLPVDQIAGMWGQAALALLVSFWCFRRLRTIFVDVL